MSFKWLTFAFICVINAGPGYSQDTTTPTPEIDVEWTKYPFFVTITDNNGNPLGGGAIISDEFVLTNQDVVDAKAPSDIRVISQIVEKKVSAIFFTDKRLAGFLAILQVSTRFDLNATGISSIDLPNESASVDVKCAVVGVETEYEEKPANILHFKNITTIDNKACMTYFKTISVPEEDLCTTYEPDTASPIAGVQAAGDLLLCDGHLTGIASSIHKEIIAIISIEVFGDVMYHKPWIIQQMLAASTDDTTVSPTTDTTGSGGTDVTTTEEGGTTLGDTTTANETEIPATTAVIPTTTHSLAAISSYSTALILCSFAIIITMSRM